MPPPIIAASALISPLGSCENVGAGFDPDRISHAARHVSRPTDAEMATATVLGDFCALPSELSTAGVGTAERSAAVDGPAQRGVHRLRCAAIYAHSHRAEFSMPSSIIISLRTLDCAA